MRINRDILNALKIGAIYIQKDTDLLLCVPLKMKESYWIISTEIDNLAGSITMKIKYDTSYIKIKGEVDTFLEDAGMHSFLYTIKIIRDENMDETQKAFFSDLDEMERKHKEWNKRCEDRYDIGTDETKGELFGLKSLEQTLIFNNVQYPCLLNNVSFSGAKLTTYEADYYKGKMIILCLSFIKPIEQIQIVATIKNASIKILENRQTISILSLKFNSSPIEYKYRMESFIKRLEDART